MADGASENGVRRLGKGVDKAFEGENLAWLLQTRRNEVADEQLDMQCYWCVSHAMDVVAEAPEKQIAYIKVCPGFT